MTRFGRDPRPLAALAREAAEPALAEAGVAVEHAFFGLHAPEETTGDANAAALLASALGIAPAAATRVETATSSGAAAVEAAFFAVKSGLVRAALVVGAERMTHLATAASSKLLAQVLPERERAHGLTMPALAALVARRVMAETGLTREDLARVPVKAHAHGALSERAHFRKPVTLADVLGSGLVADPLRVFDCAPVSDGAAAVVLTARPTGVRVAAIGHATDAHALADRRGEGALTSFAATRAAARVAFERAGRSPRDVHVAEVHDAFSILELVSLEDLGFFPRGEAGRATASGATSLGGAMPVNVGGGLKARGHPVGASGVAQVVELAEQLAKRAGKRQVDGARVALAHSIGGFGNNNLVTILEAA